AGRVLLVGQEVEGVGDALVLRGLEAAGQGARGGRRVDHPQAHAVAGPGGLGQLLGDAAGGGGGGYGAAPPGGGGGGEAGGGAWPGRRGGQLRVDLEGEVRLALRCLVRKDGLLAEATAQVGRGRGVRGRRHPEAARQRVRLPQWILRGVTPNGRAGGGGHQCE